MPSTNGHGPKLAILYARVSTDEQASTGYSLDQQIGALREWAAVEGKDRSTLLSALLRTVFSEVHPCPSSVAAFCPLS